MSDDDRSNDVPAFVTPRFHAALAYASMIHDGQVRKGVGKDSGRKGNGIPYIAHLLGVCANALNNDGTETEAIAALLHDAAEDQGGKPQLQRIRELFGDDVARIVDACSDSLVDTAKGDVKAPWTQRKRTYLEHLEAENDASILLVSACDKLDNLRAIVRDYKAIRDELWERFNKDAGKQGSLWYYERLVAIFAKKAETQANLVQIAAEMETLFATLPQRDPAWEPA